MGLKRPHEGEEEEGEEAAKASRVEALGAAKVEAPAPEHGKRAMQGQLGDKHSIDSDDEDNERAKFEDFERMKDDDELIEGQEDDTMAQDGEITITPFNLKEEQQEGTFSKDGDFVWNKKEEIKDAWLDDVAEYKLREKTEEEREKEEAAAEAEDEAQAKYDELRSYRSMLELMRAGESVARALRRLGGGQKAVSQAQRWKKKKAGAVEDPKEKENKEKMLKLTGIADEILTRSGNMEIYELTYEGIVHKIKSQEEKKVGPKAAVTEDMDDDDALDMFADNLDGDKKEEEAPTKKSEPGPVLDDVSWEFKWKEDDAELHGPHGSQKMLDWQESGFFDAGILVRKVGTQEFRDSKRIDFELYV